MMLYIVEWQDPDEPYAGGIAGVFSDIAGARRLAERFKGSHASVKEWPLNFGDLPAWERAYQDAAWESGEQAAK